METHLDFFRGTGPLFRFHVLLRYRLGIAEIANKWNSSCRELLDGLCFAEELGSGKGTILELDFGSWVLVGSTYRLPAYTPKERLCTLILWYLYYACLVGRPKP